MIEIYAQLIFMFIVFTLGGFVFQRLFIKKEISVWLNTWLGVGVLTAVLSISHLFFPTNWVTVSVITLLLFAYAVFDHKKIKSIATKTIKKSKMHWSLFVILFIVVILVAGLVPGNLKTYDTGLYHDQYVQWSQDHPAIVGLANFMVNFGFNSTWFLTNAFFNIDTYYVLNAFILILFIFSGLCGMNKLLKGDFSYSSLYQSSFVLFSPFFIRDIPSLSNDIVNSMLVLTIFLLGIRFFEKKSLDTVYCISFLSLFALTVKLSAIPVGLLVLFVLGFYWYNKKKFPLKEFFKIAGLSAIVIIPWIIRAIIVTGYILFPIYQIDVLDVEWKVPVSEVRGTERWIESWAKIPGVNPNDFLDDGLGAWLPTWISNNSSSLILQVLVVSFALFILYSVSVFKLAKPYVKEQWPVIFSALFCLLFWFLKAPDVRFGYGFIVCMILVCLVGIFSKISDMVAVKKQTIGLSLVLVLLFVFFYIFVSYSATLSQVGYPPIAELANYQIAQPVTQIGNYTIYAPIQGDQCFNVQQMCSPMFNQKKTIELLGTNIRDGMKRAVSE